MVLLSSLKKVAIGGAFICLGTGLIIQNKIQNRFRETEFYKKGLAELRKNKKVIDMFGEPIRDFKVDLSDLQNNAVNEQNATLAIPVKGPKENGKLFLWASKDESESSWQVDRLELQLKDDQTKRLLVYDRFKNKITNNE